MSIDIRIVLMYKGRVNMNSVFIGVSRLFKVRMGIVFIIVLIVIVYVF